MTWFHKEKPNTTPVVIQIEANIQWLVTHDRAANVYVGVCPPLNLNAIGDTWIDFQECANDALSALLLDLFRSGEFEQFMKANGWRASAMPKPGTTPRFDIPFDIRRTNNAQELMAAHA